MTSKLGTIALALKKSAIHVDVLTDLKNVTFDDDSSENCSVNEKSKMENIPFNYKRERRNKYSSHKSSDSNIAHSLDDRDVHSGNFDEIFDSLEIMQ